MKKYFLIVIVFALAACSARKVNKSETTKTENVEATIKTEKTADAQKVTEKTEVVKADVKTDEYEVEPVDTSKAIEITSPEGKTTKIKNGKIKSRSTADKTSQARTETVKERQQNSETTSAAVVSNKTENATVRTVDKKEPGKTTAIAFVSWAWLLILVVAVAVLWYVGIIRRKKQVSN